MDRPPERGLPIKAPPPVKRVDALNFQTRVALLANDGRLVIGGFNFKPYQLYAHGIPRGAQAACASVDIDRG